MKGVSLHVVEPEGGKAVFIYNNAGLVILVIGFGVGYLVVSSFGTDAEGPWMVAAGALIAALDVGYRWRSLEGSLFAPDKGGSLFFLPAWSIGAFWCVLGIVRTVQAAV